jgi:hypothetical protein
LLLLLLLLSFERKNSFSQNCIRKLDSFASQENNLS